MKITRRVQIFLQKQNKTLLECKTHFFPFLTRQSKQTFKGEIFYPLKRLVKKKRDVYLHSK